MGVPALAIAAALLQPGAFTVAAPPEARGAAWYVVRVSGTSGPGCQVDQTATFTRTPAVGPGAVWTAELHEANLYICRRERHVWIDGRTCPALARALGEIPKLPAMRFAGPDEARPTGIAFDTAQVSLTAQPVPMAGVQTTVTRTEMLGPLTQWWWRTSQALEPCWSPNKPPQAAAAP